MSARITGVIVTFDEDMHADDAKVLTDAIGCMRHVVSVVPVEADAGAKMESERMRLELFAKIRETFFPKLRKRDDR